MKDTLSEVILLVSSVVSKKTGNIMGPKQAPMVENRLKSRMIKLGIQSPSDYLEHFKKNETEEIEALVSLMTTHHTFFFREFNHFEFLRDIGLKNLMTSLKAKGQKKLRVWSAACSRGHEVYSLAMFLNVHLKAIDPQMDFEIIGTDIDPDSVEYAKRGKYAKDELKSVPQLYLGNFWTEEANGEELKACFELKSKVKFQVENLLELDNFLKNNEFHIIFCRNVFIYFDKSQIEKISRKIIEHLYPDGYFILGVSESITGFGLPLRSFGNSIYERSEKKVTQTEERTAKRNLNLNPYQVLVIDDSKTIHALMKKIFTRDQGFEINHIATNGREAIEFLSKNPNKVEMITLDLHMPELDGIGFLTEYKDRSKPILVVSAIDRDDAEGPGQKALKLGAFDYVEKPTVENLERIGNEIRSKLTTGFTFLSKGQDKKKPTTKTPNAPTPSSGVTQKKSSIGTVDSKFSIGKTPQKKVSMGIFQKKTVTGVVAKKASSVLSSKEKPYQVSQTRPRSGVTSKNDIFWFSQQKNLSGVTKGRSPTDLAQKKSEQNKIEPQKKSISEPAKILTKKRLSNGYKPKFLELFSKPTTKSLKGVLTRTFDKKTRPLADLLKGGLSSNKSKSLIGLKSSQSSLTSKHEIKTQSLQNKVKVLIVDDSDTIRKILKSLLIQDPRFEVVGESANPLEVENLITKLKPNLITLDIHMPEMDGVTLLKKYITSQPIPTVMISSISMSEGQFVLDALENGAVDYIQKPSLSDITKLKDEICDRLYTASKAKVKLGQSLNIQKAEVSGGALFQNGLIAIGSSTGGTEALRSIFERLPENIPPILVTQHIPAVFSKALADRLNQLVKFKVIEAHDGDIVEPNHVYIAPGGKQMGVEFKNDKLTVRVTDDEPVNHHKPSVDYLFYSIAKVQSEIPNLVGVILTGMGADGAKGLKLLRDQGAYTIGQNEASCVVYGMPRVAFEIGAVQQQVSLDEIPQTLVNALSKASKLKAS
jgi:chemotaxis protein methyltransferase CheR